MCRSARQFALLYATGWALLLAWTRIASGACDLIPQAQQAFRAPLGTVNRPFASPGDVVEIDVRRTLCDVTSPGLAPTATSHVVTVVFKPPQDGPRRAVVLASNCTTVQPKLTACANQLGGGGSATCLQTTSLALANRTNGPHLNFRFPDTDALVAPDGDAVGLAGPVAIGVTAPADALPCSLATTPCTAVRGLIACVDEIFESGGTCAPTPDPTFPSFTALPAPNDYSQLCFADESICDPVAPSVRVTIDTAGNLLVPMDWRGVLSNQSTAIFPRLLRGTFKPPVAFQIPSSEFLHSYTPEGASLPPIFEPQADPDVSDPSIVTLFGSADAPASVLRVSNHRGRCAAGPRSGLPCASIRDCDGSACVNACTGGVNDSLPCAGSGDCPDGLCGQLYDAAFLEQLIASGSALAIPRDVPAICQLDPHDVCTDDAQCTGVGDPCVTYALEANEPVALESLTAGSDDVLALTTRETVAAQDLNGDGDLVDVAATLRDRSTGQAQPLGAPNGFTNGGAPLPACGLSGTPLGRAVTQVSQPPFRFSALETEGDVMAFLESEVAQNHCDENADIDRMDAVVRVFGRDQGELTTGVSPPRAADVAPVIDRRSLAVSGGKVFFRSSEEAMGRRQTVPVDFLPSGAVPLDSTPLSVSADGRFVAFLAFELGGEPVYVRNLATQTVVASGWPNITNDMQSSAQNITDDFRYLVVASTRNDLLAPGLDANGVSDVFVFDRCVANGITVPGCAPGTERVSITDDGLEANGASGGSSISGDGRFVAFASDATNLVGGDVNALTDVFVRDRCIRNGVPVDGCNPSTELVSVATDGSQADGRSGATNPITGGNGWTSISGDGRIVVFVTEAHNFEFPNTENHFHPYARDRLAGTTQAVDVTYLGTQAVNHTTRGAPIVSADGRVVIFATFDGVVPSQGNAGGHFARDLALGLTDQIDAEIFEPAQPSSDGRYVIFITGTALVPTDTNNLIDLYRFDRLTGTTERISVRSDGGQSGNVAGSSASMSSDGRLILFSGRFDLDSTGTHPDISTIYTFARLVDPTDPLGVDDLLFPNGSLSDDVLEVLDTTEDPPALRTLCPATEVSIAGGMATFLRPESSVGTPTCDAGSLNADADVDDLVAQLWPGTGAVQNLGLAATAVAMSSSQVAALVSEAGEGTDLNDDDDELDDVVHAHPVGGGSWDNVQEAADVVRVCGDVVAFITPEAAQAADRNGDDDTDDRVLQLYVGGALIPVGQAAEDFVCGETLVAFRTREAAQDADVNLDGDQDDDVLQVWDIGNPACLSATPPMATCLRNTEQALIPCTFQACDPRTPYRVLDRTVKFLTLECDQGGSTTAGCPLGGTDLNANGTASELILQIYDFDADRTRPVATIPLDSTSDPFAGGTDSGSGGETIVLAQGRCRDSAAPLSPHEQRPCVTNGDCPANFTCQTIRSTPASPDTDDDGMPDHIDNCPYLANADQADDNGDFIGTACSRQGGTCGDGIRDYGEACDDGLANGMPPSCCTQACELLSPPCIAITTTSTSTTTTTEGPTSTTTLMPVCPPAPASGCGPAAAQKSTFSTSPGSTPAKRKLKWKWLSQAPMSLAAFGSPTTATSYRMCVYDGSGNRIAARILAGGQCGTHPCWKASSTSFKLTNKAATPDGIMKLSFTASPTRAAKITATGKGANLGAFSLPFTMPVRVQLLRPENGTCWEATFVTPSRNDGGVFKATSN